jgi:hypothetical protein
LRKSLFEILVFSKGKRSQLARAMGLPLFEKEGLGEICSAKKSPSFPLFLKGGCRSARADPIQKGCVLDKVKLGGIFITL